MTQNLRWYWEGYDLNGRKIKRGLWDGYCYGESNDSFVIEFYIKDQEKLFRSWLKYNRELIISFKTKKRMFSNPSNLAFEIYNFASGLWDKERLIKNGRFFNTLSIDNGQKYISPLSGKIFLKCCLKRHVAWNDISEIYIKPIHILIN